MFEEQTCCQIPQPSGIPTRLVKTLHLSRLLLDLRDLCAGGAHEELFVLPQVSKEAVAGMKRFVTVTVHETPVRRFYWGLVIYNNVAEWSKSAALQLLSNE
jgi:hypothetical protein